MEIYFALFLIFIFLIGIVFSSCFIFWHTSEEYSNKELMKNWNKIKNENNNEGHIECDYIYGLDNFIPSELAILNLNEEYLTITNNNKFEYKLLLSKVKNIKILDKTELKNSAISINLGIVSSLAINKEKRQYLIILYETEESKTLIFDITKSKFGKLFYDEFIRKCSLSNSEEL